MLEQPPSDLLLRPAASRSPTTLLRHQMSPSSSSFSIEALLSTAKDTAKDLQGPLQGPLLSPPLVPHQLLFPGQLVGPGPAGQLQLRGQEPGPLLPSNLPFDLLARSYMSGILGRQLLYTIELQTKVIRRFPKNSKSRRRPLLEPSPG